MPRVKTPSRRQCGQIERQVLEGFEVPKGGLLTLLLQGIGFGELRYTEGRCDVRHVVLEAGRYDIIGPGGCNLAEPIESIAVEPVSPHEPRPGGDFRIAGD